MQEDRSFRSINVLENNKDCSRERKRRHQDSRGSRAKIQSICSCIFSLWRASISNVGQQSTSAAASYYSRIVILTIIEDIDLLTERIFIKAEVNFSCYSRDPSPLAAILLWDHYLLGGELLWETNNSCKGSDLICQTLSDDLKVVFFIREVILSIEVNVSPSWPARKLCMQLQMVIYQLQTLW